MPQRPHIASFAYALLLIAGLALAWLAHDAPLVAARGWLYADALSALALIALAGQGLAARGRGSREVWAGAIAAGLFGLATIVGHLAAIAGLLIGGAAALLLGRRTRAPALGVALAGLGMLLVGTSAGEWRISAPGAGAGLNSAAFALMLLGALLAADTIALARGRTPAPEPLAAIAALSMLLRLFSLGPWNLGWLFAALVAGGGLALGAAWQAAAAPRDEGRAWLGAYFAGLALAGAGLGSGAGVILAGFALLTWPLAELGLADPAGPRRPLWLLSGIVPLTAPFMLTWMAVAAAVAGGLTLLAAAVWVGALLAATAVARFAAAEPDSAEVPRWSPALVAGALSLGLGLGAPLAIAGLLGPVAAQLQGGLTPFGEISLWPWAGLIALDAAKQPVATLPSLALSALMLILAALCWVVLRALGIWGRK